MLHKLVVEVMLDDIKDLKLIVTYDYEPSADGNENEFVVFKAALDASHFTNN